MGISEVTPINAPKSVTQAMDAPPIRPVVFLVLTFSVS
jgi:hypothetical protein